MNNKIQIPLNKRDIENYEIRIKFHCDTDCENFGWVRMQTTATVNNPKMQYGEKVGVLEHMHKISQITVLT